MQTLTGLLAVSGLMFGQTQTPPQPKQAFEAADIHLSAKTTNLYMRGGSIRGGRYDVRNATLLDLIATAYNVDRDRVQGGPAWLSSDRYDIAAKVPAPASQTSSAQANANAMLQALLADRFKLAIHPDSKAMPVYALIAGKGKPKMKQAAGDGSGPSDCQGKPQQPGTPEDRYNEVACRNLTMEAFSTELFNMAGNLLGRRVVDATGIKGAWDFDLHWSNRRQAALSDAEVVTIFDAVDKQLGLKLEARTAPLPVMIIDSVERPSPNLPGIISQIPPAPPAEFEVAEIRPSAPDEQPGGNFQNGRVDVRALPLKELIEAAWEINSDDLIADAPKFTETAKFDIVAKVSTDPAIASSVDDDELMLMLRALLVDRFKLATHMEDRPVQANVLTAPKPKLQKANPANRAECKEGPGADGKDPRAGNPMLNRMLTCTNMTMGQFAEQLPVRVSGYVQTQVRDETGLDGAYDFTFAFSGVNILRNALQGKGGANAAADPSGALSLQDALSKQLGLKLELQKRKAQVLVVDHVEEKPAEN